MEEEEGTGFVTKDTHAVSYTAQLMAPNPYFESYWPTMSRRRDCARSRREGDCIAKVSEE